MMKTQLLERFITYSKMYTESDPNSSDFPSTRRQLDLAVRLVEELKTIGMHNVKLDRYGYVTAILPSNTEKTAPVVGFLAHLDTSPDISGKNVHPKVFEYYNGENLVLNEKKKIILKVEEFPEILAYKGQTIITSDGTTLLGADDKAGIAEIITAMEYLIRHPEIKHGTIKVAFTPDEEIGKGVNHFDVHGFNADYAFTIDGGPLGELQYENFNAAMVKINFTGRNIHPGNAKGKMINSLLLAHEFINMLPKNERPENTEDREGFFHLMSMEGNVEKTKIEYIIRDHDNRKFEKKKDRVRDAVDIINARYGMELVKTNIRDQYYNMKKKIEPVMHIIDIARKAMTDSGIDPVNVPIRGGTDGARLSYMGLPCPNIFTGGHNFHGRYEYIPLESMIKAVEVIVRVAVYFENKDQMVEMAKDGE